ncbi:MAG: hypothetical protein EX274_00720 [Marine Group I thaumarchaeote]|jgi:uncharacterized membrane protein YeaQ/YmgE (transglycosylase-associated protein family)|uniref:Uncharacterized protein n=1 Tax=Marine Group I thaumarchaeote TaxID=2511932 RepID=A0A7K4MAX4_9ARCH|nr:hypothetical protein [Marine Group I thaumarchaeote]NWJ20908.1 hypothetical protein [Marine Group I thaumarchaeote]NWJ76998.1 hypothetical protein [Marine Group I thaumarchaeote]|tara:strand:+ start:287 stop:508 length:222 start_codon:yes stop_codon:yes gene_type:complete
MQPEKERSNWWYLVPIFLGLIGGIVAYFALRNDDRRKAKNCLFLGIILGVLGITVNLLFLTSGITEEQFGVNI